MIVGAAGGSRILTEVFWAIFHHLYMNRPIKEAINERRLHHQLVPYALQYETGFDGKILQDLKNFFGHELLEYTANDGFTATTAITVKNGVVDASFDPRRGGSIEII